jgi:hypothetical protein
MSTGHAMIFNRQFISLALIAVTPFATALLFVANAQGTCDRACAVDLHADISLCRTIYGNDAFDPGPSCAGEARDDYAMCLQDCADPLDLGLGNQTADIFDE